jgi:hypothetical protein
LKAQSGPVVRSGGRPPKLRYDRAGDHLAVAPEDGGLGADSPKQVCIQVGDGTDGRRSAGELLDPSRQEERFADSVPPPRRSKTPFVIGTSAMQ